MVNNLLKQMGNARFLITRSCSYLGEYLLSCKILLVEEILNFEEGKFTVISDFGDKKIWYLRIYGFHRSDGPAIECANGNKSWFNKGKRHREDGPAIEWESGYKAWYFKGERHRISGPAIEYADGTEEWWVDGRRVC